MASGLGGVVRPVGQRRIGCSRVKSHDHQGYDVVAGAAIGEGSAFLLTRRLSENVRVSVGGDTTDATMAVAARF